MSRYLHMPSFGGATGWLNSEPPGPADLRDHVVFVDFWTLTCINWLRTAPYIRAWAEAYADDGLVVIGVHTPEFGIEHDAGLVARATKERGIGYPVALDNDYAVWNAFANHYWPALYFVAADGTIRDHHFGEGRYARSERLIQQLLAVDREPVGATGVGIEAEADWEQLRTPETYLGYSRGDQPAAGPGDRLRLNQWALTGGWTAQPEFVVLDEPGGSIAFRFHARDAHLVLSTRGSEPIGFQVLLDGEPPGRAHGVDVDEDGTGVLRDGRLYQLVRQHGAIDDRTLEIRFDRAGAEAFVFTFG
ncbi:hypothetical protein OHA10_31660 [Kribbella sp. NBC_00662]|uniref:hypothetical protein n=1 Tax=Kribbella sp. NBC_00662 TaxID=2975969 RepID=UPI0032523873